MKTDFFEDFKMKKNILIFVLLVSCSGICFSQNPAGPSLKVSDVIKLPAPKSTGVISLEQALSVRRSVRSFTEEALSLNQVSQLCWSAQGITEPNKGFRTAPSPGAIYPFVLYVMLPDGLYTYNPEKHELSLVIDKDVRISVFNSSFNQRVVQKAPCTFILAANIKKVEAKYRNRGEKFTYMEAGHIAENIQLQAVTLGLGAVPIGVMDSKTIAQVCKMPDTLEVIYMVPVGNPTEKPILEPIVANVPTAQQTIPSSDISSKHVAIIVPSRYFNDTDFYGVQQALIKEGIQPVIASTALGEVKGQQIMGRQRNILTSTILVRNLNMQDYDAFVFVGGTGFGADYLYNADIINLVRNAYSSGKIIAAISEAPAFFAYANIVRGKNVTSSTSVRNKILQAGGKWQRNLLVVDGSMITAGDSAAASVATGSTSLSDRFGTALIGMLKGQKFNY
jgi:SagB-type dehydrogenase family enzyme